MAKPMPNYAALLLHLDTLSENTPCPSLPPGQRSSSLHYAACFGRPAIAKVLLKHGANPDLRDEDGKTPLDKARERIDEGHREVAAILQSPAEWMIPTERDKRDATGVAEGEESSEPRGDPEMAPLYLRRLLPVFCHTFQSTMLASVRYCHVAIRTFLKTRIKAYSKFCLKCFFQFPFLKKGSCGVGDNSLTTYFLFYQESKFKSNQEDDSLHTT